MRITRVDLRVDDVPDALAGLAGLLGLQVAGDAVRVGWTRVVPVERDGSAGVDHLAILVPGASFAAARAWLAARTALLDQDRRTDFEGPAAWASTSVYFDGPGGSILELIAHRGTAERDDAGFGPEDLLGICEVGLAVPDVDAAVASLAQAGLAPYAGTASPGFAAVGTVEGKVILVPEGRPWLPTPDRVSGAAPLVVETADGPDGFAVGAARLVRR